MGLRVNSSSIESSSHRLLSANYERLRVLPIKHTSCSQPTSDITLVSHMLQISKLQLGELKYE